MAPEEELQKSGVQDRFKTVLFCVILIISFVHVYYKIYTVIIANKLYALLKHRDPCCCIEFTKLFTRRTFMVIKWEKEITFPYNLNFEFYMPGEHLHVCAC